MKVDKEIEKLDEFLRDAEDDVSDFKERQELIDL